MKPLRIVLAAGLLLAVSHAALAEGKGNLTLSTSYNYSTGDYGQDVSTHVHYVPVTAKWKMDAWTAKLIVPWLSITGPGVVVGGAPVGTPRPERKESGLGDITPSLAWAHRLHSSGTTLELTGIVKLPTADEDELLGTGKTDYTLQAGLIQPLGKAYVSASIARRFNGESDRFPLNDVWKASAGAGYKITDETTVGFLYDHREAQTATGDDLSMLTAYGSRDFGDWSVQLYGSTGFTDGSPDASVGVQLSKRFDLW